MATEPSKIITDLMKQTQDMLAKIPLKTEQAEEFWKAQSAMLKETEAFSKAWITRRQGATDAAIQAVRKIGEDAANPAAAFKALSEWQQDSMERAAEEMEQWVDLWSRCAGLLSQAELEAGAEVFEEVEKNTKDLTKAKHSTPV